MILKVAHMGHPVLRQVARDLTPKEIRSPEMQMLVEDMLETLHEYNGAGLAAPQVHQGIRLLVIGMELNPRYPDKEPVPQQIFFNLHFEGVGDEKETDWEGCLSLPGLRGQVPRFRRIQGTAVDRKGKAFSFDAEGFLARVIQHEGDHLDGVLYIDRMTDLSSLSFIEEFSRYHAGENVPEE